MEKRIEKIMSCFVCVLVLVWLLSVIILGYTCFSKIIKNETDNQKYYADLLQVIYIDDIDNIITFKNSNGFIYIYQDEIEDIDVGDFYSCLMLKSGIKNNVRDDVIIDIWYERPDMFENN